MQGHGAGHKGTLRTLPNARRIVVHHGSMAMHNTHGTDPVTGFGATWRRQAQLHGVLLTRQRRNKPPSRSQNDCTNRGRTVAVEKCNRDHTAKGAKTEAHQQVQNIVARGAAQTEKDLQKRQTPKAGSGDTRCTGDAMACQASGRHTAEHVEKKREYKSTKTGDKQPYFNSKERVGREAGAAAERMKEREVEKEERILERN
ncbi:hypothetical protein V6N12_057223 [Hibiscus sabdariffa]|uniref:Uncharacterized protein n=1 Tax=Hibiscus sabdariffa TaxID=183260 RepID=A0ABR2B6L9_9ROSI